MTAYASGRVAAEYMVSRWPVSVAYAWASRMTSVAVQLDSVRSMTSAMTASGSAWAMGSWPRAGVGPVTTCAVLASRPRVMATYCDSRESEASTRTCAVSTVRPWAT